VTELSRSQIDRLGVRLRSIEPVPREDLELLQQVRAAYDDALASATSSLRERLGLEPTSRLKTVQTIIEKLQREKGRLSTMQDIAGARVVADITRDEQDKVVASVRNLYPGAREIDRRARPSFGYRAVHVVVTVEGRLVEIQVRTELQNLWAQLLERLADQWGRQIRYGGSPNRADELITPNVTRQDILKLIMDVSSLIDEREGLETDLLALQRDLTPGVQLPPDEEEALRGMKRSLEKGDKAARNLLRQLHLVFQVGGRGA
jgi:ppGpp synthetase/RelA/SpoT-type nucleotidyltranferase